MPTIKQIEEGYFNYLTKEIFKAIDKANDYSCKEFCLVKVEMMINLHKLLDNREDFLKRIETLRQSEKK